MQSESLAGKRALIVAANGGADIIVHVAGGASAPSGGFATPTQSSGTTHCSSTSSQQYASIAA